MLWPETARRDDNGALCIGGVPVPELVAEFGTPLYVYDEATLRNRAKRYLASLRAVYPKSRMLFAGKASLSPAIIAILHSEGLGLDVVSGGELYGGLLAGVAASEMTFHGNNKSKAELREAIAAGVGYIAIDNDLELEHLSHLTSETGTRVRALLRLNPGIDVHTHAKIKTGAIDSKFGFPLWTGDAERACATAVQIPGLDLRGYHVHLGSQLFDPDACGLAVEMLIEFGARMRERYGIEPSVISPGGGFGIAYTEEGEESAFEEWAKRTASAATEASRRFGLELPEITVEPGRTLVGPAAIAVYEVGAHKRIEGVRHYVSVDGGMADNIRPTLYDAVYTADVANRYADGPKERVTIAGRFCESGDILIKDIELPALESGDLLAMPSAGAYSLPMASNYNATPRPAVVIVNDGVARLARRRETYADVFAAEIAPSTSH